MTGGDDPLAAIMHGDVVPISEMFADRFGADGIVERDIVEGLVRKHHAPTEGIVRAVALEHGDVVRRIVQLDADCGIEPCGTAAKASDLHATVHGQTFSSKLQANCLRIASRMALATSYFKLKYLTLKLCEAVRRRLSPARRSCIMALDYQASSSQD